MSIFSSLRMYAGKWVLILIIMEYALWAVAGVMKDSPKMVLILIIMEYALWVSNILFLIKH